MESLHRGTSLEKKASLGHLKKSRIPMGLDDLKRGHPGARLVLRPAQRDGFEARFPPVRLVHVVHVPVVLFHDIAVVYS